MKLADPIAMTAHNAAQVARNNAGAIHPSNNPPAFRDKAASIWLPFHFSHETPIQQGWIPRNETAANSNSWTRTHRQHEKF